MATLNKFLEDNKYWLLLGNTASLVAGIVIEALLIEIYLKGLSQLFKSSTIYLLLTLPPIGVIAYMGYTRSTNHARKAMKNLSPLALLLASIGAVLAYIGALGIKEAGLFIVAAYYVELLVGLPLSRDFERLDTVGARLFLIGVSFFVVTLALILVNYKLAILPLVGNSIKILGFTKLIHSMIRGTLIQGSPQ